MNQYSKLTSTMEVPQDKDKDEVPATDPKRCDEACWVW